LFSLGWSFEEVLPFFKISEDNRDYSFAKDSIHHAVGGPQPVSQPKFITPLGKAFLVKKSSSD
jgi:choline dehydrogenase-like flavoprotein